MENPYGWKYPKDNKAAAPEPPPTGHGDMVIFEVTADLIARAKMGIEKCNTPLRVNNGRDALNDLYQELLDATMYLKQAIMERDLMRSELAAEKGSCTGAGNDCNACACSECDGDHISVIEGGLDV